MLLLQDLRWDRGVGGIDKLGEHRWLWGKKGEFEDWKSGAGYVFARKGL